MNMAESGVTSTDLVGLLEGLHTTRAIRRYLPEAVPDDALNAMLFAATRAPSGSNRQPFRFLVLRDGEDALRAKELIAAGARDVWAAKRANDGYDERSGQSSGSPKARMAATMEHYVETFADIPVVVLACLVRYREANPVEGASLYPACQNLLLAARALGYGGALSGFHMPVEEELRSLLHIPENVFVGATITLGKPAGRHGPVRRRPLEELVFDGAWDRPAIWASDPDGTRFTQAGPPKS